MRQFTRKTFSLIPLFYKPSRFHFIPPNLFRYYSKVEKPTTSPPFTEEDDDIPNAQVLGIYNDESELPEDFPQDLPKPKSEQSDLKVLQTSVDRLAKKQDELSKQIKVLDAKLEILANSIHMLAESHVNQRVPIMLRSMNLVDDTKIPFQKGIFFIIY